MSSARSIAAMASLPQISFSTETETGLSGAISVGLDAGFLDDLAPLRVVFADEARELGGRVRHQLDALWPEPGLEVGAAEDLHYFRMDLRHHVARCLGRNEQA